MAYQVQLKVCGWRPSRRRLTVTRGKHARERAGAGATLYKPVNKQPWVCHALWLTGPASVAGVSSPGALMLSALVVLSQGKQKSFSQSQDSKPTETSMLWFHWLIEMQMFEILLYRGSLPEADTSHSKEAGLVIYLAFLAKVANLYYMILTALA